MCFTKVRTKLLTLTILILVAISVRADPVNLRVATFNVLRSFDGTVVGGPWGNLQADPFNLQLTIDEFNSHGFDFVGLQEAHDYSALETLANDTGMNMEAAKTHAHWIYPPAVFSAYPILSYATYNFDGTTAQLVEIEVQMPDGSIIYVFSIHLHWDRWKRVQTFVATELILRRAGSYPVLIFGDMNANTNQLIQESRGTLSVLYDVNIDAIVGTAHFERVGNGTNLGNLGFSDHPMLMADITYTPGSAAQSAVPSLYHTMRPGQTWTVGSELVPDPAGLTGIKITRLPGNAQLKVGTTPLSVDEVVLLTSVPNIVYLPGKADIGKDYWSFELVEDTPPAVSVPRFVDINVQTTITDIEFAQYTDVDPPSTAGHGYANLDYSEVGGKIYAHLIDDHQNTDYDLFNDNLPAELRDLLYIRNGGRNESQWPSYKEGPYTSFRLTEPSEVFVALCRRADGSPRDLEGWTQRWDNVQFNDGNALGFDIFSKRFDAESVFLDGNNTPYHNRYLEENMVVFANPISPNLVPLPDINANGTEDLAVVRPGSITAENRDGQSGLLQKNIRFLGEGYTPVAAVALPDADGNGVAELAVLGIRNSDGRIVAEIRNITGAEAPRLVWFAANHTPVTIKVIEGDADNNGVPELAVLSTRNSDGRIAVEVKNAFGPTNPNTVWYMSGNTPVDLEVIPDKDANGVPEIAVLSFRNSDGRIVTEVKNAAGLTLPTAVWFMPGNSAIDLVAVDDKDSNGIPEVAVLSSRNSDGRNVVEIKNASGPTAPTTVWFMAGNTATDVAHIHDADSNGVPEVAVLSIRDSDGRIVVEVKNVTGATNPNTMWYSSGFTSHGLATIADTDSNSIEEALVLMIRDSDGRILVQGRNAAGNPAPIQYWFSP